MDIKYDLTDVFTKLESLSSIPDIESDGYTSKKIYNEKIKEQLNNISSTFVNDLTAKIGEAYKQNFKIYVEKHFIKKIMFWFSICFKN